MLAVFKLIRVKHYIKNVFILIPLFFSGQFINLDKLADSIVAFIAFCFVASAVYILNDYFDIEADRQHETKKNRPLAAGTISVKTAFIFFTCLLIAGFLLIVTVDEVAALLLVSYAVLNVLYSFYLKKIPLLDINIIAIGFVIRLFIGANASDVALSQWIVIMTFLLALFLGMAKRRDDVLIFEQKGVRVRKQIGEYTKQFLDQSLALLGGVIIVAYLMYVTNPGTIERIDNDYLYLNSIFVIAGILRYLYRTLVLNDSGSPTKAIYSDKVLQVLIVAWASSFVLVLYL